MHLNIITPEKVVFSDDVDQATIPTQDGEITVLPHHIPIVGLLKAGELLIRQNGTDIPLAVSGGIVQVRADGITILADTAERVEEIIEQRAEEAHKAAEKLLAEKRFDAEEYATIAAKMEKELARLHVVRKWKHKAHGQAGHQPQSES